MRLERSLVLVHLVEEVDVRILRVLQHVEPVAPRLVPLGAQRVGLDRLEEALALIRLDAHLHPHREHGRSPYMGAPTWPPNPQPSQRPGSAGALLCRASVTLGPRHG